MSHSNIKRIKSSIQPKYEKKLAAEGITSQRDILGFPGIAE